MSPIVIIVIILAAHTVVALAVKEFLRWEFNPEKTSLWKPWIWEIGLIYGVGLLAIGAVFWVISTIDSRQCHY